MLVVFGGALRRPEPLRGHTHFNGHSNRKIMVASLRYLDTFAKSDGSCYFADRNLIVDWIETRLLNARA